MEEGEGPGGRQERGRGAGIHEADLPVPFTPAHLPPLPRALPSGPGAFAPAPARTSSACLKPTTHCTDLAQLPEEGLIACSPPGLPISPDTCRLLFVSRPHLPPWAQPLAVGVWVLVSLEPESMWQVAAEDRRPVRLPALVSSGLPVP